MSEMNSADHSRTAVTGDTVTVEYTGTLPDGRIFDRATPENPFVFTMGAGQVLPAFESPLEGMQVGETKTFAIPPGDAYGIWKEELVVTVPRQSFPEGEQIQVGKRAKVADEEGNDCVMQVLEVSDTHVKLDGNHPLAGYTLSFNDVTLTAIN